MPPNKRTNSDHWKCLNHLARLKPLSGALLPKKEVKRKHLPNALKSIFPKDELIWMSVSASKLRKGLSAPQAPVSAKMPPLHALYGRYFNF